MSLYEDDYPSEEYTSDEDGGTDYYGPDQHHHQQYYSTPLTPTRYYYGNDERQTLPTIEGTPNRPGAIDGEDDENYDDKDDGDIPMRSNRSPPATPLSPPEMPKDAYYDDEDNEDEGRLIQPTKLTLVDPFETINQEEDDEDEFDAVGADEAVLDLAELEQLQDEAEKMKGLGNKHMAAQEFTRAYNAYSAALKLSPVGPSSHVFLSNRAASLLSLKRYSAAAVDSRRAIALAPTFGKAHARLGQALYFLKDYSGAVEAYEDAVHYEPDNAVTWTYLSKAKTKLAKAEDRRIRREMGEEVSIAESESAAQTVVNSIATDPNKGAAIVSQARGGNLRNSSAMMRAAAGDQALSPVAARAAAAAQAATVSGSDPSPMPLMEVQTDIMGPGKLAQQRPPSEQPQIDEAYMNGPDTDFEEAVRLHDRATVLLSNKQYRAAVDEFSAALFLVPDDENLSSRLYIGRAHALNGSKRHESAVNDARLSLKLQPDSPEAYSVLAQSYFYLKEYEEAIEAFENCQECLGPGEELSIFDQAYLQKAQESLKEEASVVGNGDGDDHDDHSYVSRRSFRDSRGRRSIVPKLKPPRFVSREEVIASTPNMPPMPKAWPQQTPNSPSSFRVGQERKVTFLSEAMGVKLNRGCDGIVRVLSVLQPTARSPIIREGEIEVGDVLREAAGVDIRRPITNIMWGDTVALIKMAPRPITVVFAKEETEPPPSVLEEMSKAAGNGTEQSMQLPINHRTLNDLSKKEKEVDIQYHYGTPSSMENSSPTKFIGPSPASGEESVAESIAALDESENIPSISSPSESETGDLGISDPEKKEAHFTAKESSSETQENNKRTMVTSASNREDGGKMRCSKYALEDSTEITSPTIVENTKEVKDTLKDTKEITSSFSKEDGVAGDGACLSTTTLEDSKQIASPTIAEDTKEVKDTLEDTKEICKEDGAAADDACFSTTTEQNDFRTSTNETDSAHVSNMSSGDVRVPPTAAFSKCKGAATSADNVSTKEFQPSSNSITPGEPEIGYTTYPRTEESASAPPSKAEEEISKLEGEILFDPSVAAVYGWTNEKWLSTLSTRVLFHHGLVTRLVKGKFFFSKETYVPRTLALFKNPNLILVLRLPKSVVEVKSLLALRNDLDLGPDSKEILIESFLVVESIIDPNTCKMCLSPLTTVTSITGAAAKGLPASTSNMHYPRRRTCFELITPTENVLLSAIVSKDESRRNGPEVLYSESRPFMETTVWEAAIAKTLQAAHGPSIEDLSSGRVVESDQGWKHQIVLGTLHSYVVSGDFSKLEQVLETLRHASEERNEGSGDAKPAASSQYIDADIIDAKDESCRTALHYACSRRSSPAVRLLVNAGANCSIPCLLDKKTPCHLSAERLDEKSLSMMLSVSYPVRSDPNALDTEGRTPMYAAAVAGRAVGGSSDPIALGLCLSALEAWGGYMFSSKNKQNGLYPLPHPVHCVASEWRSSDLTVVLSHSRYFFPLDEGTEENISVGALFNYPVHTTLISLRKRLMMLREDKGNHGFEVDQVIKEPALVSTLRVLFEHGFEPNERVEATMNSGIYAAEMNRMYGFTPFQILLVAALEAQETIGSALDDQQTIGSPRAQNESKRTKPINASMIRAIMTVLQSTAEILLRHGARTRIDSPPTARSPNRKSMQADTKSEGDDNLLPSVDRTAIQIEGNSSLMEMLGGENLLRNARAHFAGFGRVGEAGRTTLNRSLSSAVNSDSPGGSDEGSCAICWKEFGMIMNRKHMCRVSQRYVCDECSSKRVVSDGKEYRVSDGQFLLAKIEGEKAQKEDQELEEARKQLRQLRIARAQAARSAESREALDDSTSEKNELFSGAMKTVSNFIMGDSDEKDMVGGGFDGITSSLNQAKDALNERGDKLNSLADKTAALKDASSEFEQMAKELERNQRGFW